MEQWKSIDGVVDLKRYKKIVPFLKRPRKR